MGKREISDLHQRLSSDDAETGWASFLDDYGSLIYHIAGRYGHSPERVDDCFLYICEALCEDSYKRLRRFDVDGPASFKTWLRVVVNNLCIDWRRKHIGRPRPFRAIMELPELDQLVYRAVFEAGMSMPECLHSLQPRYPELTSAQVSEIVGRLHTLLTPRQHWLLMARNRETVSLSDSDETRPQSDVQSTDPGPESLAELEQQREALLAAMAHLSAFQRLLLRLRYQDDLTLKEVARLTGLGDPFRAKRQIQAALDALAAHMDAEIAAASRKKSSSVRV